jgi:DNA uptake protein ComE-like DNA-binding protein
MSSSQNPLGGLGRKVTQRVTSRLVSKLAALAMGGLLALVGLKQCGKPQSREQIAERSTQVIDVNSASIAELELLPRVNEALARRIIAGRPYRSVEDLERVSGIGPKTLELLRPRVTVGSAAK